jgi:hypothetical protein
VKSASVPPTPEHIYISQGHPALTLINKLFPLSSRFLSRIPPKPNYFQRDAFLSVLSSFSPCLGERRVFCKSSKAPPSSDPVTDKLLSIASHRHCNKYCHCGYRHSAGSFEIHSISHYKWTSSAVNDSNCDGYPNHSSSKCSEFR